MKLLLSKLLRCFFPDIWYYLSYRRASAQMEDKSREMNRLFQELINDSHGKTCLQIGVRHAKYAPHWISVDLYDRSSYIDYNYDVQHLKFESDFFDIVVCNAILEHVEDPLMAVGEICRVLKQKGLIWVEVPFNQPYHPTPNDYWRVTLPGMRIWMKAYSEISAGFFKIDNSPIYNGIFFYGSKK